MRALRKQRHRGQQLLDLIGRVAMAKHRQAEGGLGDEDVARHHLERRAGRIGRILVVAGRDDAGVLAGDRDLRRAQHMAGGMEFDRDVAEPDLFAIADRLRRAGEILAIAQPHDVERFLRRQHRAMAGAGMVGMAVRDHGALDGADRIDMEAARLAAQAGGDRHQDVLRSHFGHIGSGTVIRQSALLSDELQPDCRSSCHDRFPSMPAAPVPLLRRSARRPPLRIRARSAIEGRSCCRRRSAGAGRSSSRRISPRPGSRSAKSASSSASATRRSRRFASARAADPRDRHGASLRLMRLGAEPLADMPKAYVQSLFDQYAPRFEAALLNDLDYRGPDAAVQGGAGGARGRAESRPSSSAPSISAAAPGSPPPPSPRQVDRFIGIDLSPRHDRAGPRHRPLC